MLLGAQRRTLSGFSSTSLLPHTGYIYHCDVVQTLPPVSADTSSVHAKSHLINVGFYELTGGFIRLTLDVNAHHAELFSVGLGVSWSLLS